MATLPKYCVMDGSILLRIKDIQPTAKTYRFHARGLLGLHVAKQFRDKKFRFFKRWPHQW